MDAGTGCFAGVSLTTSEAGKPRNLSLLLRKSRDRADIASITIEVISGNRYHRRALVGWIVTQLPDVSGGHTPRRINHPQMTGYSHDGLFGRGKT
jgi:hypothetical protein